MHRRILQRLPPGVRLVACGGIGSGEDAAQALQDGAALVQVYSALIFEGPLLVRRMNRELETRDLLNRPARGSARPCGRPQLSP